MRRLRALALVAGVLVLGAAESASAQSWTVTASVKGAGSISHDNGVGATCEQRGQVLERAVHDCPTWRLMAVTDPVTLTAKADAGWTFAGWLDCNGTLSGDHHEKCVLPAVGRASGFSAPRARFLDEIAPTPPSDIEVDSVHGVDGMYTATWSATENGMTFRCKVDAGASFPCQSGTVRVTLHEGRHTFAVQAIDINGNAAELKSVSVTVVDTEITAAPLEDNPRRFATFAARSGLARDFECAIDGGGFAACGRASAPGATAALTLPAVADGRHTLQVRGRVGSDVDLFPATRTWIQDTIPPETSLRATATGFDLSSNERDVTFRCRVDSTGFGGCGTPYVLRPLLPGPHAFEAHAIDRAGNVDPTPTRHTWTIVPPAPAPTPTPAPKPADAASAIPIADATPVAVHGPVVTAPQRLDFQLRHAFRGGRLTDLAVIGLTMRADLRVIVKCPKRKRCPRGFAKWNVKRDLRIARLVGKRLPSGTQIRVRARAGQLTETKTISIRKGA
jgi:hypothetical protein